MELYASEEINDIQNQNRANKQVTNLNKTIKYSGIEHVEKSNIGKNSKSNEVHT